jgi:hypothetical protein
MSGRVADLLSQLVQEGEPGVAQVEGHSHCTLQWPLGSPRQSSRHHNAAPFYLLAPGKAGTW